MNRCFVFLALFSVLIYGFSFGFNFGGGGSFVGYIPGDMIKLPVDFGLKFENGIVVFGGEGEGGIGWHMGGIGGGGSKTITDNSGNKYTLGASFGMGYGMKCLDFGAVKVKAGLGFGGFSYTLGRVVNDDNTGIDNFKSGNSTGRLDMSIDYLMISPVLKVSVDVIPTMGIYGEAMGMAGYSTDGWHYETGYNVSGIDQENYRFLINYMLSAGVDWGF